MVHRTKHIERKAENMMFKEFNVTKIPIFDKIFELEYKEAGRIFITVDGERLNADFHNLKIEVQKLEYKKM